MTAKDRLQIEDKKNNANKNSGIFLLLIIEWSFVFPGGVLWQGDDLHRGRSSF